VIVKRIEAELLERQEAASALAGIDGLLVPGGFGHRGIEGKIQAVRFAREHNIPYFGICLGMQVAVIEYARHKIGLDDANSTEFQGDTPHPVICLLEEQRTIDDKGGTMRLGAQPCILKDGSLISAVYRSGEVSERHRHRYEFNPDYRERFERGGMSLCGNSPSGKLVEAIEIPGHPWFVAVQFHPEFKSKPNRAHPLFSGFIEAALKRHQSRI
jgi:CTP synthase